MTHPIIKTESYLLVVDESEIKEGDWLYGYMNNNTFQANKLANLYINSKKIIYHLPLNNAPVLEGIELLPPLEDEDIKYIHSLAFDEALIQNKMNGISILDLIPMFIKGYNKAKEVYKFTEEDICEFVEWMNLHYRALEHTISFKGVKGTKELINLWKEQQPKLPTEFDTETKQYIYEV
ncbi:MAG: hypothetical protein IM591_12295 [Chitinophagaceae bacterium]|uniref:hypothetical protein n=1 Tax=Microcystis sp. M061S2 TaxID=2771171 RepID=UPI0025831CC6|nr:hypothetical protein [Microcystis sp. M061S2]MCA2656091.1 hypothetical protein [Microcystis sp. M061S2]MCA6471158.1 hypothetical protein [Chitinophagaceae bacterium]